MKRYLIQRDIPGMGGMSPEQFCHAARTSNEALAKLSPKVQWQETYVADDGCVCHYLAEDEDAVREHARLSGFPANHITEVTTIIDPTTANA